MSQKVQEDFLGDIRKNEIAVTVFLINGVKLQGVITWFDDASILLHPVDLQTCGFDHHARGGG